MTAETLCPVSGETLREERVNFLTHLAGFCFSLIASIILVIYATFTGDLWRIISCSVYGVTLISLYGASSYYHGCKVIHHKRTLRIVDHACIYLLIAGTYTPFTLIPLRDLGGHTLLYIEWGIALLGVGFKIVAVDRFRIVSTLAYLGMGWLVMFNIPVLIEELSVSALVLLISGGLSYSFGTVFYLWETLPFNHGVWHLFVLGGSVCHYCAILDIVAT